MRRDGFAPIIVTGIGRSGTSVVTHALPAHPQFVRPKELGEAPFLGRFARFLQEYEDDPVYRTYHLESYRAAPQERSRLFNDLMFRLHVDPADPAQLDDPQVRYWVAKAFPEEASFAKLGEYFPAARFIYVIRNGIEVVSSARRWPGFAHLPFAALCRRWSSALELNRFLETAPGVAVIRHEALVADPHGTMARTLETLGIAPHPGPGDFVASNVLISSFAAEAAGQERQAALANRAGDWTSWTRSERAIFTRICGEAMRSCGYALPDDSQPPAVAASPPAGAAQSPPLRLRPLL